MTTAQAASRLGIDRSTVVKMINHGLVISREDPKLGRLRLFALKFNGKYDISRLAVRMFVERRKLYGI